MSTERGLPRGRDATHPLLRIVAIWWVFFATCLGLGYPTLARYDPRTTSGLPDTAAYYQTVVGGPQPPPGDLAHRILVPFVARPIHRLAIGRVGSWDPVFVGLLVANALFTATTAVVLVKVGEAVVANYAIPLLGGTLYLLNFAVANLNLAGLVDAGEACFLMLIAWALLNNRWSWLPGWAVAGALAKETFVPLGVALAMGWWLATRSSDSRRVAHFMWIVAMGGLGLASVVASMTMYSRFNPLTFTQQMWIASGSRSLYLAPLLRILLDQLFWYVFILLLPLGLWRLRQLPMPWVTGVAVSFAAGLAMGAYNDALGNTVRALFNVAGPLLSLSTALLLVPRAATHPDHAGRS